MRSSLKCFFIVVLCLTSDVAFAKGGGGKQPVCTASAPAQASAVGYNNLTFCTDFSTNQSIDTNNTLNPGYGWYISHYGAQPRNTIPPKFLLNDGTGVWLAGDSNNKASVLFTMAQIGTTQNTVGQGFSNGFYAECTRKLNTTVTSGEPSMWFTSKNFLLANGQASGPPVFPYVEVDVWDWNSASPNPYLNVYDWQDNGFGHAYGNTNNQPSNPGAVYSNYNIYGLLWVPSTQNGGTGYFKFYFNNSLISTVTYTPGGTPSPSTCSFNFTGSNPCPAGTYSSADAETFFMILGTDFGGTAGASLMNHTVKNCHVFQL